MHFQPQLWSTFFGGKVIVWAATTVGLWGWLWDWWPLAVLAAGIGAVFAMFITWFVCCMSWVVSEAMPEKLPWLPPWLARGLGFLLMLIILIASLMFGSGDDPRM
jgi:hypothetical protein